ncbi:ribulose-phosphate 3-epimerase [Miniphocaeibacter halophilus]|uniref:Ribulose-phosphate 3-epimerase n=1 Tax=Miniphocaeibacter halophilus TaxID=2931922 RepID=A0AC61MSD0_9FIRM|nr:ribulose-phosphate 3-epimerase [Miniphocaeibacter halophilus]QQK07754.1 ribulose-phosphate 3-epimerase [Miniphocaeibacter halophilus]
MAFLSPSLLAADFYNLERQIKVLEENNVKYLHLDVMDGNFVPNISYGAGIIKSLRENTNLVFDVHLMIEKPENYIDDFAKAGADIITIHQEATKHPLRVLQQIKEHGIKAGISLNPGTSLSVLDYLWDELDLILIMTVNPGFGGQSFIPSSIDKIKETRKLINQNKDDILLEIDGGVKTTNLESLLDLGVDIFVSGSDIFNKDLNLMKEKIEYYLERI